MADGQMTPADFAALAGSDDHHGGMWAFLLIILFFICGFNGSGWGGNAQGNGVLDATLAASAAQGGYVTSSQLNDALRLQEIQGGQQGINANLSATEQRLTANQTNLLSGQAQIAQAQQSCCADVKYNSAMNTASINETTVAQTQRVLDRMAEQEAQRLRDENAQLKTQLGMQQMQAQTDAQFGNVNRRLDLTPTIPHDFTYNAGPSPYCGCNCCGA